MINPHLDMVMDLMEPGGLTETTWSLWNKLIDKGINLELSEILTILRQGIILGLIVKTSEYHYQLVNLNQKKED
jgi:hypothetical protein